MTQSPTDLPKEANWQTLLDIIAALRAPNGCPWDLEQTHRSLVPYAIEEAYELAEAIEAGDDDEIVQELGDVLLQVVLHAQIASETKRFSINHVVRAISEKMIRRHPHVFGPEADKNITSEQVLERWQEIKKTEKQNADATGKSDSKADTPPPGSPFRFDVPTSLPALMRSAKIGEKTRRLRFDWPNWQGALAKIDEELSEVKVALKESSSAVFVAKDHAETGPSRDPIACEIGDLLFSVAQLARHRGLDPEQCLRDTNARFERRFGILQKLASARASTDGRNWESRSQDELEELWQLAKAEEYEKTT